MANNSLFRRLTTQLSSLSKLYKTVSKPAPILPGRYHCLLVECRIAVHVVLYFETVFVEAYPGSGDTLDRLSGQEHPPFSVFIGTLSAAQGNTEATSSELTTQPAGQAEPDPEVLQRNTGSGNAPTWFLIVLALLIVIVILMTRRLRR